MNLQFYDKLGYSYTAKMIIRNTEDEGIYTVELDKILDSENVALDTENFPFGGGPKVNKTTTIGLQGEYSWTDDGAGTVKLVKKTNAGTEDIYTMDADGPTDEEWAKIAEAYGIDPKDANALASFKTYTINHEYPYTYTDAEGKTVSATGVVAVGIKDLLAKDAEVTLDANATPNTIKAISVLGNGSISNELQSITFDSMEMFGTVTLKFDTTTGKFESINGTTSVDINLSTLDPAGRFSDITVDFTNITMYNNSGVSTVTATNGDTKGLGTGRKLGQMSGISISNDGKIYASYDNGMSRLLGQIAVATFSNASGLEKDGDNLYKATQNSGDFDGIGVDITADGGYMTTGILEMSNVDLSAEFTEMITTQRGFQANSRIITVSDTLLEELINLKR